MVGLIDCCLSACYVLLLQARKKIIIGVIIAAVVLVVAGIAFGVIYAVCDPKLSSRINPNDQKAFG